MAGNNLGTATGSVDINTSSLKNADIALRSAGDSMINMGMQMVGAFAAIVGEAAKFEKEMDFVQAVTEASAAEMDALKASAIDLAKNSVYGPIELAAAFVELVKAGATAEQIIGGVGEAAVNLATAADVEIPFAGENLINIMNSFKLGAEDATAVADLLAGAANASSVDLMDLVTTMRYAGPVAHGAGIDIEDLTDAISILGQVGIKGSTAGTSLRQIMLNLSPATKKARDRMEELGIITEDGSNKFFDAQGNAKELSEVFQILGDSLAGATAEQKNNALRDLFGVRAIPSALELMLQGEEGFDRMNEAINRTTAADVAAKRMDNLDGSIKRLKATLSAIFVEAGGPFQQMLKGWVDGLRDFLLFIDSLPDGLKTFIVGAIGAIGVLSLFAGAFLLTIGNIVRMVRVMGELVNAFKLIGGLGRLATGANALGGAGMLLNPWVLLAAAIVAIGVGLYLLYQNWEPFRNFVNDFWDDVKGVWASVSAVFGDVMGWLDNFFQGFTDLAGLWDSFWGAGFGGEGITTELENIHGVLERLGLAVQGAWNWLKGFAGDITGSILGAFESLGSTIGGASQAIIQFFEELPGKAASALGELMGAFGDFMTELPGRLGYMIGFIIGRWIRFLIDFYTQAYVILRRVIGAMISFGIEAVTWAIEFGTRFVLGVIEFVQQLPGMIIGFFMDILTFLIGLVPQMVSTGQEIGLGFITGVLNFLIQLPGRVMGILTAVISGVRGFLGNMISLAIQVGQGFVRGIVDLITGLPGLIRGILSRVISAFTSLISTAFNAARNFAKGLWNGFKAGLGINSPSYIEEALFAIDNQMDATGKNMRNGIRGMQSLARGVPALNSGALGITTAKQATAQGVVNNQNAPLIGTAYIREEADVEKVARRLDHRREERLAAAGRREIIPAGVR